MAVLLNIVKHLKMSAELKKKRNTVAYNNVCPVCSKDFAQQSNRDIYIKNYHQDSEDNLVIDNQRDEVMQNETIPSMILAIDTIALKVSPSLPPEVPVPNDTNTEEDVLPPNEQMEDLPSRNKEKTSRLEQVLTKIKIQLDYTMNLTERELKKLKMELKDNQKEAVEFITDCFDDIMEDNCFIT